MKKRTCIIILVIESFLLIGLSVLSNQFPDFFPELCSFPFRQIALGLNALASLGKWGSGFAMMGYALLVLSPTSALFFLKEKKCPVKIVSLLFCSVAIAVGMLGMIDIRSVIHPDISRIAEAQSIYYASSGLVIWSGILLCAVVFTAKKLQNENKNDLPRFFPIGLYLLLIALYTSVCQSASDSIGALLAGKDLAVAAVTFLSSALAVLSFVFQFRVLLSAGNLLNAYRQKEDPALVSDFAAKTSSRAVFALILSTALFAFSNLIQLILSRYLRNSSFRIAFPIAEIGILVLLLLLAKVLEKNSLLTEDNNLFI